MCDSTFKLITLICFKYNKMKRGGKKQEQVETKHTKNTLLKKRNIA